MQTLFNFLEKWHQPFVFFAYFALMMGMLSLWVRRAPLLWGTFCALSIIFAKRSGLIEWEAFIPLFALVASAWIYSGAKGSLRNIFFLTTVCISFALMMHLFPGFHNITLYKQVQLTPDAAPYSLWANYDKAFAGLILLAMTLPLIQSKKQWKGLFVVTIPWAIITIIILQVLSVFLHIVHWDPKLPLMFFSWTLINFFFVAIPEEALFRGVIQKQIGEWLGNKFWSQCMTIVITAIIFTAFHVFWIPNVYFLGLVFIAGILYGMIYQYTKLIESSILTHFAVNAVHFFLFTYPILQ